MRGEGALGEVVVEVVAEVGEEGAFGLELLDKGDGAVEVGVAGVGVAAEGVEDEDVEVLEEGEAFGREVAHVGEVGGGAEAVSGNLLPAVEDGNALEGGAEERCGGAGGGVDAMEVDAGAGGVAVFGAEGVVEDALDGLRGVLVGVDGDAAGDAKAEGAEIVEAHDVVGVAVGVEGGVDAAEVFAEGLGVEVRAGVDEDDVVVVGEADGGAGPPVMGVSGGADGALAAEGGHAHGGSAAEKGEGSLHGISR